MSLRTEQSRFVLMIGRLIIYSYDRGYQLTFGDAYRDPRAFGPIGERIAYGRRGSNHKRRLAVDFNLFVDGHWIQNSNHYAYEDLTKFWIGLGGSWVAKDANHFSILYQGMR